MKRLSNKTRDLVEKARESALLAVEVYNKPATTFRSGGYIVLMNIAWTSLFHAIFERDKVKYYYTDKNNPRRYQKIDGDYKTWELSTCLKRYFGGMESPVKSNLEFLIGIRNKIEHRFMPELDIEIFGECQASLLNFEDLLVKEFGEKYALNENLVFALQFSQRKQEQQLEALCRFHSKEFEALKTYINSFRLSLPETIKHDLSYSFRVYLIPKVGNHKNSSDVAIEFVKYDPSKPEEMKKYERIAAIVKEKQVHVVNPGMLKPTEVTKRVSLALGKPFNPSHHHSACWKYYKVRPLNGDPNPANTNTKYCHYDAVHKDYIYTEAWVNFLIKELSDEKKFNKVMGTTPQITTISVKGINNNPQEVHTFES